MQSFAPIEALFKGRDFDRQIIPHRQIASKACPGSQFPYAEFRQLVAFYRSRWEHSPLAQERIAAFRLKPFLNP